MRAQTTINPEMFILARESRGLTQNELKDRMDVTQGIISKVEQGLMLPSDDLITSFSKHLRYPREFFFRVGDRYPPASPFHRKRQALPEVQAQVEAISNIRNLHIPELLDAFDITSSVRTMDPDDYKRNGPVEIAKAIRQYWKLPRGPINNLTSVMEGAGIVIIYTDFGTSLIDGITFITDIKHPVIYINKGMPTDRIRLTLAHELGHIIMHNIPKPTMEDGAIYLLVSFWLPGMKLDHI